MRDHRIGTLATDTRQTLLKAYSGTLAILVDLVDDTLRTALLPDSDSELEANNRQLELIVRLTGETQLQRTNAERIVQAYFSYDPLLASDKQLATDIARRSRAALTQAGFKTFVDALNAAFEVQKLTQTLTILQQRSDSTKTTIATLLAESSRAANTFAAAAIAGPQIITAGGKVVSTALNVSLPTVIETALAAIRGYAAGVAVPFVVGVGALLYSSRLGNGELPERYLLQMPLAGLAPELNGVLANGTPTAPHAELPYRLSSLGTETGDSQILTTKTDGQVVPSQVRILAATHDPQRNVYSVATADIPPRTLTWTPIAQPPDASTTLPAERPEPPVYEGATLIPVEVRIDSYPEVADASLDDYVIVFPADSGLPPLYVMFRDRREEPETGNGDGVEVGESWSKHVETLEGAPIPAQVATLLKGLSFRNWTAYRNALWKAVADDPFLSAQFDPRNIGRMKRGRAPAAREHEWVGDLISLQIHHKVPGSQGGDVYNSENLIIVTPKQHHKIHYGKE